MTQVQEVSTDFYRMRADFGWNKQRTIYVEPKRVFVEITLSNCCCETCKYRWSCVEQSLKTSGVKWHLAFMERDYDVKWACIKRQRGEDPIALIERTAGLKVRKTSDPLPAKGERIESNFGIGMFVVSMLLGIVGCVVAAGYGAFRLLGWLLG